MYAALNSVTTKQLIILVFIVSIIWTYTLLTATVSRRKSSDDLKREIVDLSEQYVKALAREHKDVVDGPYSGRLTGYDLKKTIAVLLQDMLERISNLEILVRNGSINGWSNGSNSVSLNGARAALMGLTEAGALEVAAGETGFRNSTQIQANIRHKLDLLDQDRIDFVALLRGAQESCDPSAEMLAKYPECEEKIEWMRQHWKSDKCYRENGVDGSDCSFIIYLSEVEDFCPKFPFRNALILNRTSGGRYWVRANLTLSSLLSQLHNPVTGRNTYDFMKLRIERLWPRWIDAHSRFHARNPKAVGQRLRKKIVIHLGLLTTQANLHIAEESFRGGPLGELVQWSDAITSLYLLGHDVVVTSEVQELDNIVHQFPMGQSPCITRKNLILDIFFTDLIGLTQFKKRIGSGYQKFGCLLRIVDTFGTQAKYNNQPYAVSHKLRKSPWGGRMLNLQQFFTMYPHTPDNSFLGFVVESPDANLPPVQKLATRIALVYGKHPSMWKDSANFLQLIRESEFEIHATVGSNPDDETDMANVPNFVINHGVLVGANYTQLLRQATVFVGLGFPYEGPAPLEAIAHGVVFLNPRFSPPHSAQNIKFFRDKPTDRKITSQHPYIEQFIGEPYSYLIDIHDPVNIKQVLKKIVTNAQPRGRVPHEFTPLGMLDRLNAYMEHQDFCSRDAPRWPPDHAIQYFIGLEGESCVATCMRKHLQCSPSHFVVINRRIELQERGFSCENVEFRPGLTHPSFNPESKLCTFQTDPLLFDCTEEEHGVMRFCPCRDFADGQVALCRDCV